jgi:hypothetical protein
MQSAPDIKQFVSAYLGAIEFTESDSVDPDAIFSDSLREKATEDCERFIELAGELLQPENCLTSTYFMSQAGHDFWLTRNRHGCGFWESTDWVPEIGLQLTDIAHSFGEISVYSQNVYEPEDVSYNHSEYEIYFD